ncbi:MAG: glucosaminidase domain-containing protein [Peptostreptococcaceae bacterium]
MKKRNIIIIMLIIIAVGIYSMARINYLKDINKFKIDISKYINSVDYVSENKVQVNWKYVCAITASLNNNNFDKVTDEEIKKVSSMFINKDNTLNTLEDVMSKMNLSKSQTKRVYDYIDDLKYYGISPDRLKEDSKYMEFINSIKEGAIENYKKYKILPSITIAQAILETGWGESKLSSKYNNLFGIKADSSWNGEFIVLETKEYSSTMIDDKFRVYENKNDSINDHAKFLYENKRYKEYGVFDGNTYKYQANALQEAGYSTHMNDKGQKIYAKQLIEIIQQYNLQLIDSEAQTKK